MTKTLQQQMDELKQVVDNLSTTVKEVTGIKTDTRKPTQEWIRIGENEWLQDVAPTKMNWEDAKQWCAEQGGRLPTRLELLDLYDNHRNECKKLIENDRHDWYWSATANSGTYAWNVNLNNGSTNYTTMTSTYQVRCVRDVE